MSLQRLLSIAGFLALAATTTTITPAQAQDGGGAALSEAVRGVVERHGAITSLVLAGKAAWDAGDFATAASNWEALLRLPRLEADVDRSMRPFAVEARKRAGGQSKVPPPPVATSAPGATPPAPESRPTGPATVSIVGTVAGGGAIGPGGTVIWLRRTDGRTPRPAPARGKVVSQTNKTFVPRVLPVTVGTKVEFRNQDEIFHNVFSLARPNDFDAGLYKQGQSYARTFTSPGPVQLLCNIHASMIGYVVVVDTPWYGQADATGAFTIKGVPPGEYELSGWHEGSSKMLKDKLTVSADGVRGLQVRVGGDRKLPSTIPDKYGKPRQAQLGY